MALKDGQLNGKIGASIRGLANAGDLDSVRLLLSDGLGWIDKSDIKNKIGKVLRDRVNLDRDLEGAITFMLESSAVSVDKDQLRNKHGKVLRDLINADRRAEAVAYIAEIGSLSQGQLASDSGEYGHKIRQLVNDDKLSDAAAELRSIYPPGGVPTFQIKRRHLRGSVGSVLRDLCNAGRWDQAVAQLQAAARAGVGSGQLAGKQGKLIRQALQAGNIDRAQQIVRDIVGEIKSTELAGDDGKQIRKALNNQDQDLAVELLTRAATTWTKNGLGGSIGGPMRKVLNQGLVDEAMTILEGALIAEAKADQANSAWAGGAPGQRVPFYGPPGAPWAVQRTIEAVGMGHAPPAALQRVRDNGGGTTIATAMRLMGENKLRSLPYVGMVITVVEFLREIPIIGDLLAKLDDLVDQAVGQVLDKGAEKSLGWLKGQLNKI